MLAHIFEIIEALLYLLPLRAPCLSWSSEGLRRTSKLGLEDFQTELFLFTLHLLKVVTGPLFPIKAFR